LSRDRVAKRASNAAVPPLHTPHSMTSPGIFSFSMRFAKTYRLWIRSGPTSVSASTNLVRRLSANWAQNCFIALIDLKSTNADAVLKAGRDTLPDIVLQRDP
jgi:hypothetical protein